MQNRNISLVLAIIGFGGTAALYFMGFPRLLPKPPEQALQICPPAFSAEVEAAILQHWQRPDAAQGKTLTVRAALDADGVVAQVLGADADAEEAYSRSARAAVLKAGAQNLPTGVTGTPNLLEMTVVFAGEAVSGTFMLCEAER